MLSLVELACKPCIKRIGGLLPWILSRRDLIEASLYDMFSVG